LAATEKDIVVGLDLGSAGITVAVLRGGPLSKREVLGVGFSPSIGIDKGEIINTDDAVGSLQRAVADAELAAGVDISYVYASADVPGMQLRCASAQFKAGGGRDISRWKPQEIYRELYRQVLLPDYSVVQLTGIRYYIDGEPVKAPAAARPGNSLLVEALVIMAPTRSVEEKQKCLRQAGLKVKQAVAGPLAVAEAVLSGMERELGVVCVDIGAALTKVAYLNRGLVVDMGIFPVGGDHITADLAVGLRTTLEDAEAVKSKYGLSRVDGHIKVQAMSGAGHTVPGDLVYTVVQARVQEILEFIKGFIDSLHIDNSLPGGIVITGGGAMLPGLPELAGDYLAMPVRVGSSCLLPESVPEDEVYRYTTAVGLALWGARQGTAVRGARWGAESSILNRIRSWLSL